MKDSLTTRLDELERNYSWLARQVEVSRGTPGRWAAGKMAVAPEHRAKVASALRCSQRSLFDSDGNVHQAVEATA